MSGTTSHRWRVPAVMAAALALVASAGSISADTEAERVESAAPRPDTPRSATPSTPSSSLPAGPGDESPAEAAADLAGILGIAFRTSGFVEPDPACFEASWAELPREGHDAFEAMSADPVSRSGVDGGAATPVFAAYLECVDPAVLRRWLALTTVRPPPEAVECVAAGWEGLLTADAVASSAAHGHGLDDLDPDLVEDLTATVTHCVPDRRWWIEDVAFELEGFGGLSPAQADCVATAYVDRLGVDDAVRRRVLMLPLLAVSDEARAGLVQRCGIPIAAHVARLDAPVGTCLSNFGRGTETTLVTDCEGSHNAEVIAVHDLTLAYPQWPGVEILRTDGPPRCDEDLDALTGDTSGYTAGWDLPYRVRWEADNRVLTCVIARAGYEPWTGPSGLVPPAPAPSSTDVVPTGDVVADYITLSVGECVFRPPAGPGQADEDRPLVVVDCDAPHQGEVFHAFDVKGDPGVPYPGEATLSSIADDGCRPAFEEYVDAPYETSRLFYSYLHPDAVAWAAGGREVRCILQGSYREELLTSSMAGSGE